MAAAFALLCLAGEPARGEARAWAAFEQRVRSGDDAEYTVTETRRVAYFHPRGLAIDHVTRLVDPFLDFLDAEFMPLPPDARFKVLISASREAHAGNAETLFGRRDNNLGTWHPRDGVLAMPAVAGAGTVTSMLVYPVMRASIPKAPQWARIAIATFFEKVYAYPGADGKLVFRVGYLNPWRYLELLGCGTGIDLGQTISNPRYGKGASHYRLLGLFLWEQDKMKTLVARLRDDDRRGYNNFLSAAFERNWNEIESLWLRYLVSVDDRWYGIRHIPLSQVFASRDAFDAAMAPVDAQAGWSAWFNWKVMRPMLLKQRCVLNEPA
jgi:hypothetical protein